MNTITIFGAQGKFGTALLAHLKKKIPQNWNIQGTQDRIHNKILATKADIAILVVKPRDVDNLLDEIKHVLPDNCIVISFVAGCSTEYISKKTFKPVIRYIADPNWIFGGYVKKSDDTFKYYPWIYNFCTHTFQFTTDKDIDLFTIQISHFYIIQILHTTQTSNQIVHRRTQLANTLHVPETCLDNIITKENAHTVLNTICTPGGVSEFIYSLYQSKKTMSLDDIQNKTYQYFFT